MFLSELLLSNLNSTTGSSLWILFSVFLLLQVHFTMRLYKKYLESSQIKHVAIVGGASANSLLRAQMQNLCDRFNKTLILSDLAYCSDNAAMIGRACMAAVSENCAMLESSMLDIDISPRSSFYNT